MKIKTPLAIFIFAALIIAGCSKEEEQTQKMEKTTVTVDTNTYYASDKFDFWQDYPGKSPKGTDMFKVTDPEQLKTIKQSMSPDNKAVVYTCEMHPNVRQNYNGKCPLCKMDLVKMEKPEPKENKSNNK
ncbi:MAG: heavy metal-binding domain-containing protein [Ignavibacteria bacterium]|jgi:PBP1b-binding outer membrane lipoprotein LpoB